MQMSYANNLSSVTTAGMEDNEHDPRQIHQVYVLHCTLAQFAGDGTREAAVICTLCGSGHKAQDGEWADAVPFITQIEGGRQFIC